MAEYDPVTDGHIFDGYFDDADKPKIKVEVKPAKPAHKAESKHEAPKPKPEPKPEKSFEPEEVSVVPEHVSVDEHIDDTTGMDTTLSEDGLTYTTVYPNSVDAARRDIDMLFDGLSKSDQDEFSDARAELLYVFETLVSSVGATNQNTGI